MVAFLLLVVPTSAFVQGPATSFVKGFTPLLQANPHYRNSDRVHAHFSVSCPPRNQFPAMTGLKMTSSATAQVDIL